MRTFENRAGVEYDEGNATVIYAEDMNAISALLSDHDDLLAGLEDSVSAVVAAVSIKQDHSENLDDWAVKGCPEGDIATHDGEETFSNKVYSGAVFSDTARFSEVSNGNSGTSKTVDFSAGNKQNLTLTGNCTLTFTSPASPCSLVFKLVQDGTGGRTVVWPSSVKWSGGTAPTLTTGAGKVDLVAFYFDGTNYFGTSSLNYTV